MDDGAHPFHPPTVFAHQRLSQLTPTHQSIPHHVSLSHIAPDKANEIRCAVTGALAHNKQSGLFCFEQIVETTFVLPWDLSPLVQPERLSVQLRDEIRGKLLDDETAVHLESSGALNWNLNAVWQYENDRGEWETYDGRVCQELEKGYATAAVGPVMVESLTETVQVDFVRRVLTSVVNGSSRAIRRLACAPLMPMKTEQSDVFSLFHAASLGFWGVNDRTNLLRDAVFYSLNDVKAQFILHSRWQQEYARNVLLGSRPPSYEEWEQAKQNLVANPQLHIFTLANVVLRPIIVYSSPESNVGGIYLPLLWESQLGKFPCDKDPSLKNPLPLAYNAKTGNFSALVTFRGPKGPLPILLPLTYRNGACFRIHFLSNSQVAVSENILRRLINIDILSSPVAGSPHGSPTKTPENLFGSGVQPLFGCRARSFSDLISQPQYSCPPTLTAVLDAPELPEVIDTLIKRYQSAFL